MALYMDIHTVDSTFTEEDAYKAHLRDIAVQDKYGVKYKKYWINFEHNTLFCLMESPNKAACIESHREAHGLPACNVIEVSSEDEFNPFLGVGVKDEKDMAFTLSGEIDTGYRTILLICPADFTGKYLQRTDQISRLIAVHKGNMVLQPDEKVMASFISASDAIECVLSISNLLASIPEAFEYRLAVATGRPVDEEGTGLFEETRRKVQNLCLIGKSKTPYIDITTKVLSDKESGVLKKNVNRVKIVDGNDFLFFESIFRVAERKLNLAHFKSQDLGKELGLSKAQTYRKIKALTGMSPNELIREMRLRRSLEILNQNGKTIAEIAYELGFNSPTYFTRVFKNRYQILPTSFAKLSGAI